MCELPLPVLRRPIHTRRVTFEGFLREDGLWDIDCELSDVKSEATARAGRPVLPAGAPMHLLRVRLTLDDHLTVRAVQTAVAAAPFEECQRPAGEPMQKLVGLTMGPGWRKAIEHAIGGVAGCTHYRELVFNAATVAFQMIPHYRASEGGRKADIPGPGSRMPFFMDKCMSWALDGAVVQRLAPHFYRPGEEARGAHGSHEAHEAHGSPGSDGSRGSRGSHGSHE